MLVSEGLLSAHYKRLCIMMELWGQVKPPIRPAAAPPDEATRRTVVRLVIEEALELADAYGFTLEVQNVNETVMVDFKSLTFRASHEPNLEEMVDAHADVAVVNTGGLVRMGLPDLPLMALVDANNMGKAQAGKLDPVTGKFTKPEGYPKPDIKGYLETARSAWGLFLPHDPIELHVARPQLPSRAGVDAVYAPGRDVAYWFVPAVAKAINLLFGPHDGVNWLRQWFDQDPARAQEGANIARVFEQVVAQGVYRPELCPDLYHAVEAGGWSQLSPESKVALCAAVGATTLAAGFNALRDVVTEDRPPTMDAWIQKVLDFTEVLTQCPADRSYHPSSSDSSSPSSVASDSPATT